MFVSHQYNTYKILDESHKQSSDAYNQKYHLANVTSSQLLPHQQLSAQGCQA